MTLLRQPAELEALRGRDRRLLAVFPHPDDEAYGCAGALARHGARAGDAVVLLCLTDGEASSVGRASGLGPDEVGRMRAARMERVAACVGADGLVQPGLPDGRLAREAYGEVVAVLGQVLDAFAPHVVIAHDPRGVNGHLDHVAAHWATRRALEDAPARLAMVAYDEQAAEAARPRLLFATPAAEMDVRLDLSPAEVEVKETCLRIHEALVTLDPDHPGDLAVRPPTEHYDLLGEDLHPLADDLFAGLGP